MPIQAWLHVLHFPRPFCRNRIKRLLIAELDQILFKNLLIYRLNDGWSTDLADAEESLGKTPFAPCGATQEKSSGWTPPRGEEHGPLIESINGQWIIHFVTESKILPVSVVQSRVDAKVQAIERESGRKPGKKERQSLKDDAKLDLLPMAFTKTQGTWVWIDRKNGWLVIDASAQGRADEIITALVEAWPGFIPRLLQTNLAPGSAMAQWLTLQEGPAGFTLGDECELKASDESRAAVRYARHALEIDEIRHHVESGKRPTRLALAWGERAFFVLTEALQVKKLAFADLVFENKGSSEDEFDADVALTTGELELLLPELVQALEGEMDGAAVPGSAPNASTPNDTTADSKAPIGNQAPDVPW